MQLSYTDACKHLMGVCIGMLRSAGVCEVTINAEVAESLRVCRALDAGAGAELDAAFKKTIENLTAKQG